jgi:hypothetical protein
MLPRVRILLWFVKDLQATPAVEGYLALVSVEVKHPTLVTGQI